MEFRVTADISQVGLPLLVEHLKDNETSYACVFVNFKMECSNWASKLEAKLAAASLTIDVLQIIGDMDKDEKFTFIRLFTSVISLSDFYARVSGLRSTHRSTKMHHYSITRAWKEL